jgi:hypothetical protein
VMSPTAGSRPSAGTRHASRMRKLLLIAVLSSPLIALLPHRAENHDHRRSCGRARQDRQIPDPCGRQDRGCPANRAQAGSGQGQAVANPRPVGRLRPPSAGCHRHRLRGSSNWLAASSSISELSASIGPTAAARASAIFGRTTAGSSGGWHSGARWERRKAVPAACPL